MPAAVHIISSPAFIHLIFWRRQSYCITCFEWTFPPFGSCFREEGYLLKTSILTIQCSNRSSCYSLCFFDVGSWETAITPLLFILQRPPHSWNHNVSWLSADDLSNYCLIFLFHWKISTGWENSSTCWKRNCSAIYRSFTILTTQTNILPDSLFQRFVTSTSLLESRSINGPSLSLLEHHLGIIGWVWVWFLNCKEKGQVIWDGFHCKSRRDSHWSPDQSPSGTSIWCMVQLYQLL